jgi:hypothetical protein
MAAAAPVPEKEPKHREFLFGPYDYSADRAVGRLIPYIYQSAAEEGAAAMTHATERVFRQTPTQAQSARIARLFAQLSIKDSSRDGGGSGGGPALP